LKILTDEIEAKIRNDIIASILRQEYEISLKHILDVLGELYAHIPESKRISFGRVYAIQVLSGYLFSCLTEMNAPVYEIGSKLFIKSGDYRTKGVSLGILSFHGIEDYEKVLPYFESSASSSDWNVREFAQMFFRRLIREHPSETREYLLRLVKSEDPNLRRFVCETLRPVKENSWFYRRPDYPLSIVRNLFEERSEYPRTSVGNNLSDLSRHLPELVFGLVEELVESGNGNSYWIAYRACRNLVKKEPIRVMDLLKVDEYRYKKEVYRRSDFQGAQGKVDPD
jgi:3-methyladenine DNA glycosylase AlkC